jgi:hypothetical protein
MQVNTGTKHSQGFAVEVELGEAFGLGVALAGGVELSAGAGLAAVVADAGFEPAAGAGEEAGAGLLLATVASGLNACSALKIC